MDITGAEKGKCLFAPETTNVMIDNQRPGARAGTQRQGTISRYTALNRAVKQIVVTE